ncbi:hypothetical protein CHUAL_006790 [Chamberlinius hualienensis]
MQLLLSTIFSFGLNFLLVNSAVTIDNGPWPLFIIGHMANRLDDVEEYLKLGANGIETDITFKKDGHPDSNYHGFPCDCLRFCFWSQKFPVYLEGITKIINNPNAPGKLAMVYFDLKVDSLNGKALGDAGKYIALDIIKLIIQKSKPENVPLLVFGVPDVSHLITLETLEKTFVSEGYSHILNRVAYDVYVSRKLPVDVLQDISTRNITKHLWYGQGYTNCFLPSYSNLEQLVEMRDRCEEPCTSSPDAIYHWTIDGPENQRNSLRRSIDGIVTNRPDTVLDILQEREFLEVYRLGGLTDIPWKN